MMLHKLLLGCLFASVASLAAAQVQPSVVRPAARAATQAPTQRATSPLPPPDSVGLSASRLAQVMEVLGAAVASGRINGAVFGVMRQGRVAWLQAVGFRDTAQTEQLKPDAIFPLAAMTQPIAAVAAMVLVERGRLKLADPLAAYLPAFREMQVAVEKPDDATAEPTLERTRRAITIQDLMRHTAGLGSGTLYPNTALGRRYNEAGVHAPGQSLAEMVNKLATLPLAHHPGTIWDYSIAPDVLARVVEVVAAMPFERVVASYVTGPWAMADTGYVVPPAALLRIAQPRLDPLTGALPLHQDASKLATPVGGSTGMVGTAHDYLRFGQALLAGGVLDEMRVLGGGTVTHLVSDHLGSISQNSRSGAELLGAGRGFGLGVSVRLAGGVHALPGSAGDYGWGGIYGTQFLVDPARDMVAVLMVNQRNQAEHIAQLFRTLVYQTVAR